MKVCMNATTVKQKENYFSVATNCTEIRIFFLTDYIIRIRAGFDGDFAESIPARLKQMIVSLVLEKKAVNLTKPRNTWF